MWTWTDARSKYVLDAKRQVVLQRRGLEEEEKKLKRGSHFHATRAMAKRWIAQTEYPRATAHGMDEQEMPWG